MNFTLKKEWNHENKTNILQLDQNCIPGKASSINQIPGRDSFINKIQRRGEKAHPCCNCQRYSNNYDFMFRDKRKKMKDAIFE